jgi:hypothetical protein
MGHPKDYIWGDPFIFIPKTATPEWNWPSFQLARPIVYLPHL